ncbi:hypothetical protein FK535_06995 [Mycolicibacterium sp. 018/SC-01/001]|uniref:hypothetical protein n=1 Tax=Mycolicibacterium sp. 018/SC-01/001 TaxID=2592069 RepID=UPI00117E9087|nr:hypothetical protein [Mycolicibacterium sp. 018/SC-01/001]TRW86212.1 hypothetical protein FK535_06995 [Mycolicibacterium sp. 018/SC-01/001]
MASPDNPFATGSELSSSSGGATYGSAGPAFGASSVGQGGGFEVAKPPVGVLMVAAVLAVIGIALGAIFWQSAISLAGWISAGPLAIGALALYAAKDTSRRALPTYLRPNGIGLLYSVVSLLVVSGIVVSALSFAFWVGYR